MEQTDFIKQQEAIEEKPFEKHGEKNNKFMDGRTDYDYYSQTLNEQSTRTGELQKVFQLSEGCLESLAEAIMQSVYLIGSWNDPRLRGNDGSFTNYLIISVLASILSIGNKYIWIDQRMVNVYCTSVIVSCTKSAIDYDLDPDDDKLRVYQEMVMISIQELEIKVSKGRKKKSV